MNLIVNKLKAKGAGRECVSVCVCVKVSVKVCVYVRTYVSLPVNPFGSWVASLDDGTFWR